MVCARRAERHLAHRTPHPADATNAQALPARLRGQWVPGCHVRRPAAKSLAQSFIHLATMMGRPVAANPSRHGA